MPRQKPRAGIRQDFKDALHSSPAKPAGENSESVYLDIGQLLSVLLLKLEVFSDYVESHRHNAEELQGYFGTKTIGRCLEMIDFENRMLRDRLLPSDMIPVFCDMVVEFAQGDECHKNTGADAKSNKIALAYSEASKALNIRIRLWQTATTLLIEEADSFWEWQNEVLLRDVDQSYGVFSDPIEKNEMTDVMERREQYFSEIKFHYMNHLLLVEDVVASLGTLIKCSAKLSRLRAPSPRI